MYDLITAIHDAMLALLVILAAVHDYYRIRYARA